MRNGILLIVIVELIVSCRHFCEWCCHACSPVSPGTDAESGPVESIESDQSDWEADRFLEWWHCCYVHCCCCCSIPKIYKKRQQQLALPIHVFKLNWQSWCTVQIDRCLTTGLAVFIIVRGAPSCLLFFPRSPEYLFFFKGEHMKSIARRDREPNQE